MTESHTATVTAYVPAGFSDRLHSAIRTAYGIEKTDALRSPQPGKPHTTPTVTQIRALFTARINRYPEAIGLLDAKDKAVWQEELKKGDAELGKISDLTLLADGETEILLRNWNGSPHTKTRFDIKGRIYETIFLEGGHTTTMETYDYDDQGRLFRHEQFQRIEGRFPVPLRKYEYTYIPGKPDDEYAITTTFKGKTAVQTYVQRMIEKNILKKII